MSFFGRQGIPEEILRAQSESNRISRSELSDDSSDDNALSEFDIVEDFEGDITRLRDFSFIYVNKNSESFTMHRLVDLTMRMWLESHGQMERWKGTSIGNLYFNFSDR